MRLSRKAFMLVAFCSYSLALTFAQAEEARQFVGVFTMHGKTYGTPVDFETRQASNWDPGKNSLELEFPQLVKSASSLIEAIDVPLSDDFNFAGLHLESIETAGTNENWWYVEVVFYADIVSTIPKEIRLIMLPNGKYLNPIELPTTTSFFSLGQEKGSGTGESKVSDTEKVE